MKLKCIDGKIEIPKEFLISESKRRLVIKAPYSVSIEILNKFGQLVVTQYFREKGKDKPYVQEGTVLIDGQMFEVEEVLNE